MLIGLSVLVIFATVLAYRGSRRWLLLSPASSFTVSAHEASLSPSSQPSRSFMTIIWSYLLSPFINSPSHTSEGRIRGVSVSEGGICTGGGATSSRSTSLSLGTSLYETKSSSQSPEISPNSTPKAGPVRGAALASVELNGKIPKLVLSNDSTDSEDDSPPAFPSINSVQRARASSSSNRSLSSSLVRQHSRYPSAITRAPSISISHSNSNSLSSNPMPPPPLPQIRGRNPRAAATSMPLPSRLPSSSYSQSTSVARNGVYPGSSGGISSISSNSNTHLRLPPVTTAPPPKPKAKDKPKYSRIIILEPGHSPLDWARLCRTSSPEVLRGPGLPDRLLKVSPSMLAKRGKLPKLALNGMDGTLNRVSKTNGVSSSSKHGGEEEIQHQMWTALGGKVYNITAYTPFHPGGEKELLRCAGKDGTELFMKTHSWVNIEGMLGHCLIGIFVSEGEGEEDEPGTETQEKGKGKAVVDNEANGIRGMNGSMKASLKTENGDSIRSITESDTWLDAVD